MLIDRRKVTNGVVVVLGAQWGDEGKGKLVDILATSADVVCRVQGGNNAGHTIVVDNVEYDFHLIPSGLVNEKCLSVIGNGCVVNIKDMFDELAKLKLKGIKDWENRVKLSERAHIVFNLHRILDGAFEEKRGRASLGTTRKGIGPTYSSKATRNGLRIIDVLGDWDEFLRKYEKLRETYRHILTDQYDDEEELNFIKEMRPILRRITINTSELINKSIYGSKKESIIVEGANACMLDIDFGTYPFVTSSNCTVGGVCTGMGIPPQTIKTIFGVVKAYTTRVGDGAFPTEQKNEIGELLQQVGHEFGVTTGRKRRCGWLDIVILKQSIMLNGYDAICLTKLDILDDFKEIKIGTSYTFDDYDENGNIFRKHTSSFPANINSVKNLEVNYETMEGWMEPITKCRTFEQLPEKAKNYIRRIFHHIECPIRWVGVGKSRNDIINVDASELR
ncbi:hypothetical protein SNEBB_008359 [Seison nebaliae]|nr:hypothetical protein SNEBB_008359 [Seison nebaliae]